MSVTEPTPMWKRRWAIVTIYFAACVALAIVHNGLMFEWLAKLSRDLYALLLPLGGPSLALNTHMSVALFLPIAAVLGVPLVVAVEKTGCKKAVAFSVFVAGWLGSGYWLAKLF